MNETYEALFSKSGDMVYISHLDLMALFRRAIRRARLPFVLTGGFSPRVKMSMPKALRLGVESFNEFFSVFLSEELPPDNIKEILNKQMPRGVEIIRVWKKS